MVRDSASQLNWLNAGAVCLNFNLRRTSRAVTQYYDEALKPTGVKVTQFTILMAIASESSVGGAGGAAGRSSQEGVASAGGAGGAAGRSSQEGVASAGGAGGAVKTKGSITNIARLAMVDRTTLTRSLKILEDDKLIEIRKAQPGNKRRVSITAKGVKKMKEIYPYWFRAQRQLARALTPVKTRELRHLLADMKKSAEALHVG
jgi:DNA-binding MarR family transcriptional regulator